MLNLLSMYAGYESWYEFKKQHLFAGELLQDNEEPEDAELKELEKTVSASIDLTKNDIPSLKTEIRSTDITDLQKSDTENQTLNPKEKISQTAISEPEKPKKNFLRKNVWVLVTAFLIIATGLLGFKDVIFQKTYVYCFTDADRNMSIQREIEIKVIKDNESPILYRIKPGECFRYATKDKILKMQISSPFYEYQEVSRNLENAPEEEIIELKPDDYKMALYYFSTKDINGGNPEEQLKLIRQKRKQLEDRISNNAVITQVYDNDIYGLETLDKEDYITLVTTPTTSLKNLNVIEMKKDTKGKIVSIKFKISTNENNK
uniref:Uncharacterized protein n=2 Tax=Chryseobacterium TaxID=59732 RepID=A0AAU6WS79_9FLAO